MEPNNLPIQNELSELKFIEDVPITIKVLFGSSEVQISDLLQLQVGSVLELNKLAGEPMDIFLKDRPIAKGEIVTVNDNYGIRLTDIVD